MRKAFLVIPGGVGFLYPAPLAALSWLGGRIRRLCPRARQPAAIAHKPAGQHPFPWVWPCLFLEAQSHLWGLGAEGRNGAVASAVLVHHTRGIGPLRLALAGATRSELCWRGKPWSPQRTVVNWNKHLNLGQQL